MNKFFKFIILIIIIFQPLCAEYYLVYQENPPLAQAQIEDIEYCVLPDGIYKKYEYFEKVFDFSRKIQRAVINNNSVFTDDASYLLTKTKIMTKPKQNSFCKNTSVPKNKVLIKIKISQIYFIEDIEQDNQKEIIFKWRNKIRIGKIHDNSISMLVPEEEKNILLKYIDKNRIFIKYKNQEYFLVKKNNIWSKTIYQNTQALNKTKLSKLSVKELEYLRFEIAARHGKVFNDQEIQNYFEQQKWYKAIPLFSEKMLNETEKENIKILYKIEGEKRRTTLKAVPQIVIPEK